MALGRQADVPGVNFLRCAAEMVRERGERMPVMDEFIELERD